MDDNSDTDGVFLSFEIIFVLLSVRLESSNIGIEALSKCGSPKNMQLLKCPLEAPAVNQPTDAQVNVVTNTCLVSMANVLLHNSCTGIDFVLWLIFHHDGVHLLYTVYILSHEQTPHTSVFITSLQLLQNIDKLCDFLLRCSRSGLAANSSSNLFCTHSIVFFPVMNLH